MAKIKPSSNGHTEYGETFRNQGQTSNSTPVFLSSRSISSHPILSMAGGKPSVPVVFVPSNTRGKPSVRPTLPTSGIVTNNRKTSTVGKSTVYVPPTNTNMVSPPSSLVQPLVAQPVVNQPSWDYGYSTN